MTNRLPPSESFSPTASTHKGSIDPSKLRAPATTSAGPSSLSKSQEINHPSTESAVSTTGQRPNANATQFVTEFDRYAPLCHDSFPNGPKDEKGSPPTTASNVAHVLNQHRITVRYNIIKKRLEITWPGQQGTTDNLSANALSLILSTMAKNQLSVSLAPQMLAIIGDMDPYNPAAEWITRKPWDGVDRFQAFAATLAERENYSNLLKKTLLRRWLISAVAAALKPNGFHSRGILTLQGPQSIGKTSWIRRLIDDEILRDQLLRIDHHLDVGSKDSRLTAISHWIVELGELDSTLKKDMARLKGFITSNQDKIRPPYGRTDAEYQRRTVFCASVNEQSFLVDTTGNTRFWTIPVTEIDYQHDIDMQQLFAQMAVEYENGERWWLDQEEEMLLEAFNNDHRAVSVIRERFLSAIDPHPMDREKTIKAFSATQALRHLGIEYPSNPQCKEAAGILREHYGEPKKIQGIYKWRIPFRSQGSAKFDEFLPDLDEDLY